MGRTKRDNGHDTTTHPARLIEGLTEKALNVLDEIWSLWEIDPTSQAVRDKFHMLEECLDHIKRISNERFSS
ncbi:MAG: hypothetical protein ACMUIL_04670 [bacterium]